MKLSAEAKASVVQKFQRAVNDTGSPEVQIALFSTRINLLTEHLKNHKNDYHSRRGLIRLVNQRRKLLAYLKDQDFTAHARLIKDLGIRG